MIVKCMACGWTGDTDMVTIDEVCLNCLESLTGKHRVDTKKQKLTRQAIRCNALLARLRLNANVAPH